MNSSSVPGDPLEILEKEKITVTVGISKNKVFAKIAADMAKPNGIKVIDDEEVKRLIRELDIADVPGIGNKTAEKLKKLGINKLVDTLSIEIVDLQACKLGVIMVIAVSCVKLLSAHNSTQHTSRKHKV